MIVALMLVLLVPMPVMPNVSPNAEPKSLPFAYDDDVPIVSCFLTYYLKATIISAKQREQFIHGCSRSLLGIVLLGVNSKEIQTWTCIKLHQVILVGNVSYCRILIWYI